MKKKNKGFTLIELLAVIVILGLLMAIAIPSVTKYITQSRKKTLTTTIGNYTSALVSDVNNLEYVFTETNTIYAVPIECISLERGGIDPFGEWYQANGAYWAYVLIQYDDATSSYTYGFTFKDSAGYGLYPTTSENLNEDGSQIQTGYNELKQPKNGLALNFVPLESWNSSGFKVNDTSKLKVLISLLDNQIADGKNTCELCQKGNNYAEIKAERNIPGTLINSRTSLDYVFGKTMNKTLVEKIYTKNYIAIPSDAIDVWDASNEQNNSVMAWTMDEDNDGMYEVYLAQENGVQAPSLAIQLFYNFTNLEEIDLSNFKTTGVTNLVEMFQNCKKIKNIDLSSFDTSKVTTMSSLFKNCESLENVNVSSFDTTKAYYMMALFQGCKNLKQVDISNFNTTNTGVMNYMFYGCTNLEEINLGNFTPKKITTISYMFNNCINLKKINVSNMDFTPLTDETQYQLTFINVRKDVQILVKDETQKKWFNNTFSDLTNIQIYK